MNKRFLRAVHLLVLGLVTAIVQAAPQDVILIVDNSGSMRKIDPALLAKRTAAEFLQQLPADFYAGVIIFDQNARLAMPLTPATAAGKAKLAASLDGMNYRGKFTDSPAAIERAIFELKSKARPDAVKTIVFVSDGVVDTGSALRDTERGKWLREELTVEAAASGIRIMPLAFTENADLLLIARLADATQGESIRAATPNDLSAAYGQMLERLKALVPPAATPPPPITETLPPAVEETPVAPPEIVPPTAATPAEITPATPPVEIPPAPATASSAEAVTPPASDTAGAVALTAEEKAALEQLAKDTGVPVEQLMKELEEAPAGQAVVVRPEETAPPAANPGSPLAANSLLLGAGAGGLLLAGLAWFFLRGKRAAPLASPTASASTGAPTAKAKPVEAFLIDVHGITNEAARRIGERQLIVGRTAGSDTEYLDYFVVNKATIGRRHAIIKFKDQMFWLVDQGSVNGTFVNNERVVGERMLKHGDRVKFHKFEFEFSYPDMADANRTVVGVSPDQTIVAAADATMSATTSALRAPSTPLAASATAAVAAATSAWLNEDALKEVPGELDAGDPFDVTEEGDLDALMADREDFFKSSGSQRAYVAPPEIAADAGDNTFDDEAAGTVALAGMRPLADPGAAERTQVLATQVLAAPTPAPSAALGLDADASAFFDDGTVGPAPDLMRGPVPELDSDLDMLDVTKVPAGIGDDDLTGNYAPPTAVMRSPVPGERTGTKPHMDTGRFGELTTLSRELDESHDAHANSDDFLETGAFAARGTLLPERPSEVVGEATSVREFANTGKFKPASPATETDHPSRTVSEDIFDVTGSPGDIPAQETVVLDNSPLHAKKKDPDPKPR